MISSLCIFILETGSKEPKSDTTDEKALTKTADEKSGKGKKAGAQMETKEKAKKVNF